MRGDPSSLRSRSNVAFASVRGPEGRPAASLTKAFVALTDEAPINSTAFFGRIRLSTAASPHAMFEALRQRGEALGAPAVPNLTGFASLSSLQVAGAISHQVRSKGTIT